MTRHRADGLVIADYADFDPVHGFFDAWMGWRGNDLVPSRGQVKTSQMSHLMSGCMLLDAVAPDTLIFRYCGSLYQDLYGFDFTGKNYMEITDPALKDLRSKRLWGVVAQPAAAVWTVPHTDGVHFIGSSVPIRPDDPSKPMMIMQVLVHLKDLHHISASSRANPPRHVQFSDRFRYLDIGGGLPDTDVEA